jgi:hypothetical protein
MASAEHLPILVTKLNDLENVRIHEESGGVLMKKENKWHLLSVYNLETLQACVDGELVADYEAMQINFVGRPTLFQCKKTRSTIIFTLKKNKKIWIYRTSKFRSIVDEVTKADIKLYLPDVFYMANNNLYDSDMIRLNVRPLIEIRVSFINSYQHVHLIENVFVFVSYHSVTVLGRRIQIEDSIYSLYFTPSRTYRLESDNKRIKVLNILDYRVRKDTMTLENGTVTYRGMVIPEYSGFVFEVNGVWLGIHNGSFFVLTPRMPNFGVKTKSAIAL